MQAPECTICSETYNRKLRCPKVLQCGHTFCNQCLRDWESRSLNGIECPKCRRVENRPVDGIPQNYDTLEYLEAHIDPRLRKLVNQNSDSMAQAKRLLDDYRLKKLPILEENKRNIDDFNSQIMEVIQIIEKFRDSVNENYRDITSKNEASLQPCITDLQNYINTTDTSIRKANQLIEDLDVEYTELQALFNDHLPTSRLNLESFNFLGAEKLKNLKKLALQLNNKDPSPNLIQASMETSPPLIYQSPNLVSPSSSYPAAGQMPHSIPIPEPNPTPKLAPNQAPNPDSYQIPNPASYQVPNPDSYQIPNPASYQVPNQVRYQVPNPASYQVPNQVPYQVPNQVPNKIPNPAPNKIPNPAPNKIPNPASYQVPNQVPYQVPNPAPNKIPNPASNPIPNLPITEQWYFNNIRENTWEPFAPQHNELIVRSKILGLKEVSVLLGSSNIKGTINLEKNKLYLPGNRWFYITSQPN